VHAKPQLGSLMDDLSPRGTSVDAPRDVTSGENVDDVQAAEARGVIYGSVMSLVEFPVVVVQAVARALLGFATLCSQTAAQRPWTRVPPVGLAANHAGLAAPTAGDRNPRDKRGERAEVVPAVTGSSLTEFGRCGTSGRDNGPPYFGFRLG
jgi:hypothetical protein